MKWLCLAVCVISCNFACGQRFTRSTVNLAGVYGGEVLFADFNNDGHQDLFASGYPGFFTQSNASIYAGNGTGGLTPIVAFFPSIPDGHVSLEDYNRDGLVDILMVATDRVTFNTGTVLYKNKGNFVFEKMNAGLPESGASVASFGDFDNDGDPDVLARGSSLQGVLQDVFQNNEGTFSGIGVNLGASAVRWADYDADGDVDFVGNGFQNIVIYENNGFDRFGKVEVLSNFHARHLEWINIDNDGLADLLILGSDMSGHEATHLLVNKGDGSFQAMNHLIATLSEGDILPIDIDQDGDTDFITAGYSYERSANATMLFTNNNGSFTASPSGLPQLEDPQLAAADVDHDNDLDVVISGGEIQAEVFTFGKMYLYINNGSEKNTRPQAPPTSSTLVSGQKATITWDAGTDTQTPSGGLSYNVYLGTAPSTYNILTPMANGDGIKTDVTGNAGYNRFKIIENLLPGTYYYRLQTVDGSQAVSVQTSEKQFTVAPLAPVIDSFSPAVATEGDTLYITGNNFLQASTVSINEVPTTFKVINSSSIRIIVPAVRHSGNIKVVTPRGTGVSSGSFCEKPKSYPIFGFTDPCFGDVEYEVPFVPGVTYHWSVDNNAIIVSQGDGKATIRFPKKATYNIKVYPETCVNGEETSLQVTTKGAAISAIGGPTDVLTEVSSRYQIFFEYQHTYTWFKDNVLMSPMTAFSTDIIWRDVGVHELKVLATNTECPLSISESRLQLSVSLNQVSYVKDIALNNNADWMVGQLVADLDNDGDDDMLLGSYLLENTGGTLVQRAPFTTDYFLDITPLDFDNDNDVDLVAQTYHLWGADVKLFVNNGGFNFVETSSVASTLGPNNLYECLAIDYNIDGKTDVAIGADIYANDPSGLINPKVFLNAKAFTSNPFVQDFNGDGYPDVFGTDQLQINGGDNGGKFFLDNSWAGRAPIHIADLDRDGANDIVYLKYGGIGPTARFSNNGGIGQLISADNFSIATFADLNLDGYTDILSGTNEFWIYQPLMKEFQKQTIFSTPTAPTPSAFNSMLDLDNDGVDEIIFLEGPLIPGILKVYKNNNSHPAPIAVPTGLTSATGNLTVDLSWDKVPGYTYNVVVGSSIGATNIVSPLANVATGEGLLKSNGNAGINNFKLNLAAGTYYWSVQAISATGVRSKFSDWKSFDTEAQTTAPSNLALTLEHQGLVLSWTDNAPNETGFVIERRSTTGAFTTIGTLGANSVTFVDQTANLGDETFYRVSALVPGKKLSTKIATTATALIRRFPHYENFETAISYPAWRIMMPAEDWAGLWGPYWRRTAPIFPMEGKWEMESLSSSHALVSPEFDLAGMENPVIKFYTRHEPPTSSSQQPVRIELSDDDFETFEGAGVGGFWENLLGRPMAYAYPDPGTGRVKFRVRNDIALRIDEVVVNDAPQTTTGLTLTQTAQNEIRLDWNQSARASHYLVGKAIVGQSGLVYDTVAAPIHTYTSKGLTNPNTYQYLVHAYHMPSETFAYYHGGWVYLTLADMPFSLSSIEPVLMKAGDHKEILLDIHSPTTPLEDVTMSATSSTPALLGNLSFIQNQQSIKLVITSDGTPGESDITVTAAGQSLSDSKSFHLSIHPETPQPVANASQKFCYDATVADLVASGSSVKWYSTPTGGAPLPASTLLVNNSHYYGSQTLNGLESNSRVDVTVTFGVAAPTGVAIQTLCPDATIADLAVNGTSVKWYNAATEGAILSSLTPLLAGKHYFATQTMDGCESKSRLDVGVSIPYIAPTGPSVQNLCPGARVAQLVASGTNITWYTSSSGGSPLPSTTLLANGAGYYASQTSNGCESKARLRVTANITLPTAPTGTSAQSFCEGARISNLSASGTSITWYDEPTGGLQLDPTTILTHGTHYFGAQSNGTCESQSRLEITVSIKTTAAPTGASAQTFCSATVQNLVANGSGIKWYATQTGGSSLLSTTALTNGSSYYASQTLSGCESLSRFKVTVSVDGGVPPTGDINQTFCSSATVADLKVTGTGIKWYNAASGGSFLAVSTPLTHGLSYYASQSINNCESATRLKVTVAIGDALPPTGNAAQSFCAGAIVKDLKATGTNIKWFDVPTGGSALLESIILENGKSYFAAHGVDGCPLTERFKVTATIVPIPSPPIGQATQTFVHGKTVADLVVVGANIKWYWTLEDALASIASLAPQTALINKTYYATQKPSTCVSAPFAVTVAIADPVTGITEPLEERVKLYPNPVRDELLITFDGSIDRVSVINGLGQEVLSKDVRSSSVALDASVLAPGVYTIQLAVGERILTYRIMKI